MRVPVWRSQRHLSVERVGPRFGPRQLSYQQGFRGGQPLSSTAPHPFISLTPLLHYLVAPSLALFFIHTLKLVIISSPVHSLCLILRLSAWGMTLPALLHSFLTAPALLEVLSEMFTFSEPQQRQLLGFFFFLTHIFYFPSVYKYFIMRGWSLKRGLAAPKHCSSKLHACLFLSRGHCRGFQIFAPKFRLSLSLLNNSSSTKTRSLPLDGPPSSFTFPTTPLHPASVPVNEPIKYL